MKEVLEKVQLAGIVPVVRIDSVEDAVPLAHALCEGGLPIMEITFRTPCAREAMEKISKEVPEVLIGAGTVLTTEQVDMAIEAGAKFVVSPGLNEKIVAYCNEKGIMILPGCANPSDIEKALELGLKVVKFFPAEAAGGLKMIKAMAAPYGDVKFMPTGGISEKNINDYLGFEKVIACGGSWMVDPSVIAKKDFNKVTEMTKEAVKIMLGFQFAHVGINTQDEAEAEVAATQMSNIFAPSIKKGNSSIFLDSQVEIIKGKGLGTCGHIAYYTNYLQRAIAYLEKEGYAIDESTMKYDAKGKPIAVYLKEEISQFAIHLLQK